MKHRERKFLQQADVSLLWVFLFKIGAVWVQKQTASWRCKMRRGLLFLTLMVVAFSFGEAFALTGIKLGVVTKPGSAQNIAAEKFKELLEKQSNGDIAVRIFNSQSLSHLRKAPCPTEQRLFPG